MEQTPETPKISTTTIETVASSQSIKQCSSIKYKLSLNKKICDKFTKKKLNFMAHSLVEDLQTELSNVPSSNHNIPQPAINLEFKSNTLNADALLTEQINHLKEDIEWKRLESMAIKKHEINIKELRDAIKMWENGYHKALELLKSRYEQSQSTEEILNHLSIPLDLFKV